MKKKEKLVRVHVYTVAMRIQYFLHFNEWNEVMSISFTEYNP